MGPKRKLDNKKAAVSSSGRTKVGNNPSGKGRSVSPKHNKKGDTGNSGKGLPPPAGYLLSCDIPTKQFIHNMNDQKTIDKKFILEDLDAEHLLVKESARAEIEREVERWMDDNVFSAIERVGENLDMS
ncbi:transcription factor TFIIH complex subunit Tfb5 [Nitzschia inconspicua]|uniref:General transcription and DNA repair factor IIH subunit TFB5 n=1 Tax=Nitzschia inconspicua TaxID=303405 RepID=A0A9K3KET8_9STRA|nr:transcription factor TFIIH complex subunit Tfb5 [Nitzschia inconspicua]